MASLEVTLRDGSTRAVAADPGLSVMEGIRNAGIDELLALCGGCCSCATCHVYVDPNALSELAPMTDEENDLLDASDYRQPNSRLSCQIRTDAVAAGLRLTIVLED